MARSIPAVDMVEKTDYFGLVSGQDVDKGALVESFYGQLETAPMIAECPINMECKLVRTVDFSSHDVFIGQVVETYCDERCLTDGVVDFAKVEPILFVMHGRGYWELGIRFASAWSAGKAFKK